MAAVQRANPLWAGSDLMGREERKNVLFPDSYGGKVMMLHGDQRGR